MEKKIKNIGKVCTSKNCPELHEFPYCAGGCVTVQTVVEYED